MLTSSAELASLALEMLTQLAKRKLMALVSSQVCKLESPILRLIHPCS